MITERITHELRALGSATKAADLSRFFKTGPGEYGEGDRFLGVPVPDVRRVARTHQANTRTDEAGRLLESPLHEVRLCGLLILVEHYERAKSPAVRAAVADFYEAHRHRINNWDLVDLTAYKILGRETFETNDPDRLRRLADSERMWDKRIAIVATMHWIRQGHTDLAFELALRNLTHPHDLMHKANGWLLREAGKRDLIALCDFLRTHIHQIPRTTLRYAIERFPAEDRRAFLALGKTNNG